MSEEDKFVKFLRKSGLKVTSSRREVLKEVFRHHHHFDAEDLFLKLKNRNAGVSRATVYRTLALLVESDLVLKMDLGRGHSVYEHVLGHPHHDHLVCVKCGRVLEFQNPRIEKLQKQVCQEFDFEMLSHTQQIYGVCKKCRDKKGE